VTFWQATQSGHFPFGLLVRMWKTKLQEKWATQKKSWSWSPTNISREPVIYAYRKGDCDKKKVIPDCESENETETRKALLRRWWYPINTDRAFKSGWTLPNCSGRYSADGIFARTRVQFNNRPLIIVIKCQN
jgi:hypothetical protein